MSDKSENDPFEDYEPFGEQWKKELMRMNKEHIVELFAEAMKPSKNTCFIITPDFVEAIGKITITDRGKKRIEGRPLYPVFLAADDGTLEVMSYYPGDQVRQKHEKVSIGTKKED